MRKNYIDGTGRVVAYFFDDKLYRADDSLVGTLRYDNHIVDDNEETILVAFHEGLYKGPNQDPIAWVEESEFAS